MNNFYKTQNNINLIYRDNYFLNNYNRKATHIITNKIISDQNTYIINLASIITKKQISMVKNKSDNIINFNLLTKNYNRNIKYRGGFFSLQALAIFDIQFSESFLFIDLLSIPSLLFLYKSLYNEVTITDKAFYRDNLTFNIDNKLIEYYNSPNSHVTILNTLLFLRSFPMFNYIMNKIIGKSNTISYDIQFNKPLNIFDMTFLSYIYMNDIEYYIFNVQNILNLNNNILVYWFKINEIEYNWLPKINNNNRYNQIDSFDVNVLLSNFIKNEMSVMNINYNTDMYLNINKILNIEEVIPSLEEVVSLTNVNYSKLTNALCSSLLIRGQLRLYLECVISTICIYYNYMNRNRNRNNEDEVEDEDEDNAAGIINTLDNMQYVKNINNEKIKQISYRLNVISEKDNLFLENYIFGDLLFSYEYDIIFLANLIQSNITENMQENRTLSRYIIDNNTNLLNDQPDNLRDYTEKRVYNISSNNVNINLNFENDNVNPDYYNVDNQIRNVDNNLVVNNYLINNQANRYILFKTNNNNEYSLQTNNDNYTAILNQTGYIAPNNIAPNNQNNLYVIENVPGIYRIFRLNRNDNEDITTVNIIIKYRIEIQLSNLLNQQRDISIDNILTNINNNNNNIVSVLSSLYLSSIIVNSVYVKTRQDNNFNANYNLSIDYKLYIINLISLALQSKKYLFIMLILYIKDIKGLDLLSQLYIDYEHFKNIVILVKKFVNTINFMSSIKNYPIFDLIIFLMFSNPDVRVTSNTSNNEIAKIFSDLYIPRYDAVVTMDSL